MTLLRSVEPLGDLGGGRGLARALQADHHDRDRRGRVEVDRLASPPSVSTSESWTILTTIWPGVTDLTHRRADRLGARAVDEGAHHLERDIRLEQGAAHLAHRRVDVLLGEGAAAGQLIEYAGELFGKALEHGFAPKGFASDPNNAERARGRDALPDVDR